MGAGTDMAERTAGAQMVFLAFGVPMKKRNTVWNNGYFFEAGRVVRDVRVTTCQRE